MAIRTNCIEYGYENVVSMVPSGTLYTVSKQITIPETTSRVFSDVTLTFHGRNSGREVVASIGLYTMSLQIDNNPSQSFIHPSGFTNATVEQVSFGLHVSGSSYFNTYFTSSRHVVSVGIKTPNVDTIGHNFKLACTYQFDDSSTTTSIKTVRLPICSITGSAALGTGLVYLGNHTASIDALDTYLPELSKSFTDIFMEYHSNDASAATTNFSLKTQLDTAASQSRFVVSQSLQSAAYYYDIHTLSGSIDTATTHSIRVASSLASRFSNLFGILHCTYMYDYTGSTSIMNSNVYSFGNSDIFTSIVPNSRKSKKIYIPEPGTIQLKRSGILWMHGAGQPNVFGYGITTASSATHTVQLGTLQTGMNPMMLSIDGTGSHIGPISLSSGYNDINIYYNYTTNAPGQQTELGSLLYLNYISGKNNFPLENTHTVLSTAVSSNSSGNGGITYFYSPYFASASVSDPYWFISDWTMFYHRIYGTSANAPIYFISDISCFYTGSELTHSRTPNSNVNINTIAMAGDSRLYYCHSVYDFTSLVRRYNNQYAGLYPRIDMSNSHLFYSRNVSLTVAAITMYSHLQYITYHGITFPVTGSITNYSGSGAGIPLSIFDYTTGEKLFETSSKVGGIIDTYWYDKHTNLFIVAETGSRYVSNVLPAGSGSYLITIPTAGALANSEHSFTFIG